VSDTHCSLVLNLLASWQLVSCNEMSIFVNELEDTQEALAVGDNKVA